MVSNGISRIASGAGGPSPWAEKRRALQARLKRIDVQLSKLRDQSCAGSANLVPSSLAEVVPQLVSRPLGYLDAGGSSAPAKRKAAEDSRQGQGDAKRSKGGGEKGGGVLTFERCEKLLDSLMKKDICRAYFNVPVDPVLLGVPTYPDIIKRPMDLGTIKNKLADDMYSTVDEWARDVELVWSNAMTFNVPGDPVHEAAKALAASFAKSLRHTPKSSSSKSASPAPSWGQTPAAGASTGGGGGGRQVLELKRTMEKLQQEVANLKGGKPSSSGAAAPPGGGGGGGGGGNKKKGGMGVKKTLTFEEKRNLSLNINKLDEDNLIKVVEIIKKRKGHMVREEEQEEIEIDIDALDNQTLRDLDKFINQIMNPPLKAPSKSGAARNAANGAALRNAAQQALAHQSLQPGRASLGGGGAREDGTSESESDSDSDSDYDDSEKPAPAPRASHHGSSHSQGSHGQAAAGHVTSHNHHHHSHSNMPAPSPAPTRPNPPSLNPPPPPQSTAPPPETAAGSGAGGDESRAAASLDIQEPAIKPQILPVNLQRKPITLNNTAAWAALSASDDTDTSAPPPPPSESQLWSQYQTKDMLNKQRQEEKQRHEAIETNRRDAHALTNNTQDAHTAPPHPTRPHTPKEQQQHESRTDQERRLREAQREEEKAKREQMQQTVNMDHDRILSKDLAHTRYMGLQGIGGVNLANLRGAANSESDSDSDDSDAAQDD